MEQPLKILWENDALKLLETRDRYTRSAILEEFGRAPERGAIRFDAADHGYLTPVANRRFSVVWRLDLEKNCALVRAVVPLTNFGGESTGELKARVERAIERESKGAVA